MKVCVQPCGHCGATLSQAEAETIAAAYEKSFQSDPCWICLEPLKLARVLVGHETPYRNGFDSPSKAAEWRVIETEREDSVYFTCHFDLPSILPSGKLPQIGPVHVTCFRHVFAGAK